MCIPTPIKTTGIFHGHVKLSTILIETLFLLLSMPCNLFHHLLFPMLYIYRYIFFFEKNEIH